MNNHFFREKDFFYLLIGFLFLILASLSFDYYVNKDRVISYEPDDNLSYLIPASNTKYCKNYKCYEENFFKYQPSVDSEKSEIYRFERQIHRLVYDYTPLYTFLLDKISNKENIYDSQKILHIFLSIISAIAIFVYLKFSTNPKNLLLIAIILGTHYCVNNWGIKSPLAWTISCFIGSLALILQFKHRKLSLLLQLISIIFHQIGLTLLLMGYAVYLLNDYKYFINFKNFKEIFKKESLFILSYITFIFIGLKLKYTPFELNELNVATVYSIDYFNILNIFDQWKSNFVVFLNFFTKTIIYLNPILLVFFFSSFFLNFSPQLKIIKIYTIIFCMTTILFIHGVGEFALGKRLWPIFVINYLLLSITSMHYFSTKYLFINYLKKIFFLTLPFFILFNMSMHIHTLPDTINRHNYQYDNKNINKFKQLVTKNNNGRDIVYFFTKETTLYYYMSRGLIQNNIFHKWQNFEKKDLYKTKYLVLDNPVTTPRPSSDLLLKNKTEIEFDKNFKKIKLIIFSKLDSDFSINGKIYSIFKGYNEITISDKKLKFEKIQSPLRIKGLKISEAQKTNWPWGKDFQFNIKYQEIQTHRYLLLKRYKNNLNYNYNFLNIEEQITNILPNCDKKLISDVDSSLIFSVECKIS